MNFERKILKRCLPAAWFDRIDLETRGIRSFLEESAARIAPGSSVLDSGAGQSPYRHLFDTQRYIAADFAKGESAWDYSGLDVICLSDRLPFRNNEFDAVISTQVLEHVAEPARLLEESHRVLRNHGRLFLTAPLGFGEHQQPYDYFRYTRFGLRYLLEKAGFTNIVIRPRGGYFWYLAVMIMWTYLYFFPSTRPKIMKWLLAPVQLLMLLVFIVFLPPLISSLDFLDRDKSVTLGFAVVAEKVTDTESLE